MFYKSQQFVGVKASEQLFILFIGEITHFHLTYEKMTQKHTPH